MRHTKSHRNNRRSQQGLDKPVSSKCDHCGQMKVPHRVCNNCGYYNGRQVLDVLAKLDKKERKKKEKEIEEASEKTGKPLDLESLSQK